MVFMKNEDDPLDKDVVIVDEASMIDLLLMKGLTDALLDNPKLMGFCYTQLTDIEQEQNGLYTYERKPKFDVNIFRKILEEKD